MKTILNYLKENLKKLKNHDTKSFNFRRLLIVWLCIHPIVSCTPISRFNRLVSKHPYLLDKQVFDTIHIRDGKRLDTSFIWNEGKDTVIINGIRIERFRDTFRLYYRERNCTTYIHETNIQPSKATQKIIREKTTNIPLLVDIIGFIGLFCLFSFALWKK